MNSITETQPALPAVQRPRWPRYAKFLVGAGAIVAVLGALATADAVASHTTRSRVVIEEPITSLDVRVSAGSMRIVGTDEPTIAIERTVHRGLRGPTFNETVSGDRLMIRSSCNFDIVAASCAVDYVVHVPSNVAVSVRGNGTNFDITSIRGDVDASINGGDVDMAFTDAPHHVKARTNGGRVTVRLPDDEHTYRVDAGANGGSTKVDVRTDPSSDRVIDAHANGGQILVRYAGAITG